MLHLHEVVAPAVREDAKYPRHLLNIGMTILASLLAWATVGALNFVRNHMA
jgi:capsule polysaccharide export protein KpsE/RkpR